MPASVPEEDVIPLSHFADEVTTAVLDKVEALKVPPRVKKELRRVIGVQIIEGSTGVGE